MKLRSIVSAAAALAAALGAVTVCASAEDAPAGYVYFMAGKSTIGQGLVAEPEKVPFYEGEKGIDVVQRAVEVLTDDTGYGAYVTAFADSDIGGDIPEAVAAVCPEMTGRTAEGYLSALDYTPESGWTYFLNGEYAMVGISDYIPADGDVVCFEFTVYGYGADLGVDNSSWGGAAALKPLTNNAELIRLCADGKEAGIDEEALNAALAVLGTYESSQEDIDAAAEALKNDAGGDEQGEPAVSAEPDDNAAENAEGKDSPSTGAEGAAVMLGAAVIAGAFIALSKKK